MSAFSWKKKKQVFEMLILKWKKLWAHMTKLEIFSMFVYLLCVGTSQLHVFISIPLIFLKLPWARGLDVTYSVRTVPMRVSLYKREMMRIFSFEIFLLTASNQWADINRKLFISKYALSVCCARDATPGAQNTACRMRPQWPRPRLGSLYSNKRNRK